MEEAAIDTGVLLEQVKALTEIVESQNRKIEEQKRMLQEAKLLIMEMEKRSSEILKKERNAKSELQMAQEIQQKMGFLAHSSLEEEEQLESRKRKLEEETAVLQEHQEELQIERKKLRHLANVIEKKSQERKKLELQMYAVLVFMWLQFGLIHDICSLVLGTWDVLQFIRTQIQIICKSNIAMKMILYLVLLVIICSSICLIVAGIHRYLERYMDLLSGRITVASILVGILLKQIVGWNSLFVVGVVESIYLFIRSEMDARDIYSPYCR